MGRVVGATMVLIMYVQCVVKVSPSSLPPPLPLSHESHGLFNQFPRDQDMKLPRKLSLPNNLTYKIAKKLPPKLRIKLDEVCEFISDCFLTLKLI